MPLFRYEVADKSGKTLIGVMDAPSEPDVRQKLVSMGYTVNQIVSTGTDQSRRQSSHTRTAPAARSGPTSRVAAPPKELAVFFRAMASYLQAGVSMHHALAQIANQTPNQGMRTICERMASRTQAGGRLSEAMAEFPRAFPPHVVGVVAAGEIGGFLPIMVGDVAVDYELAQRASNRAGRYVSWVIWIHVYGFLLAAPVFLSMFAVGVTDVQSMIVRYFALAVPYVMLPLALLTAAYFTAMFVLRQPAMRPLAHRLLLRIPWAGRASRERSLASFSRILWHLQSAGILPINAWEAASRAAENVVVASQLQAQIPSLRSGTRFSQALAATGMFTSEDQRVLASGEATGQTADVLQRIAAYYEDAALVSAGRARWLGLRVAAFAFLVSSGVLAVSMALVSRNVFTWVDWFFGTGGEI